MWPTIAAAGISAGANLLGGLLGRSSANQASANNQQAWYANMMQQRDFAQHGIRWKVEDAKKAGIHPLYALGAQTTSFHPMALGDTGDTSMTSALSNMGQDVSRAIMSTRSEDERMSAFTGAMQSAQLERAGLENELLRSQIARLHQQSNPAMPHAAGSHHVIPGQGNAPASPTAPYAEKGVKPETTWYRTEGGVAAMPSNDAAQAMEDIPTASLPWVYRNHLLPNFQVGQQPPPRSMLKEFLPKGANVANYEWMFQPQWQDWRPTYVAPDSFRRRGFYFSVTPMKGT